MKDQIEVIDIGDRKIAIKGVGKLFYQEGFPLSMSRDILKEQGIELSWLHVADELYKNEWTPKSCLTTLRSEIDDDNDFEKVKKFIEVAGMHETKFYLEDGYEKQREMIFEYLWGYSSQSVLNGENEIPKIF